MNLAPQPQTQVHEYAIPTGLKLRKVLRRAWFYSPKMTIKLPSFRDVSTSEILKSGVKRRRVHHKRLYRYSSNLRLRSNRFYKPTPMLRLKGFKRVIVDDPYLSYDAKGERFIYKILNNIHFQEFFSVEDVCRLNFSLFKLLLGSCRTMNVVMNAPDFKLKYLKLLMKERYVKKEIYLVLNESCELTNAQAFYFKLEKLKLLMKKGFIKKEICLVLHEKIKEEEEALNSDFECGEEAEKIHFKAISKDVTNEIMQLKKWNNIHVTLNIEVTANLAMITEMSASMWRRIFLPQINDLVMSCPSIEFLFVNLSHYNISKVINLILESLSAPTFDCSTGRKWKNGNILGLRSSFDFLDDGIDLKNSYRKKEYITKITTDFQKIEHNKFHLKKNVCYIYYCGGDVDLEFVYTSAYPQNDSTERMTKIFTKAIYY